MASVRGYALRGVKAEPADGPETVQKVRDRLHAMIACGEEDLEVEAYVVVGGERVPLADYAVRSLQMKEERLRQRGRTSSTVAELKGAYLQMTPEQQALPLKIVVPPTRGTRNREMFAHAYLAPRFGYRIIQGIPPGKAAKRTQYGHNDIMTVLDMVERIDDQYRPRHWDERRPPCPVEPQAKVMLCINTAESTDSLIGFHVSRIEIREDAVVLHYLPDGLRGV